MNKIIRRASALISILVLTCAGAAHAAIFNLTYDGTPTGAIDSAIVGTGTFAYDGSVVAGSYLLSSLTGVSFSAMFTGDLSLSGPPFDPLNQALIGIDVADVGGGMFELIFTGGSAATNGSLDIHDGIGYLTHEPSPLLGGNVGLKLYFASDRAGLDYFGDYYAKSRATVPEPTSLALLGLGMACIVISRKRRRQ